MVKAPSVGHVIKYAYLWRNEYYQGLSEGRKERPACVIVNRVLENNQRVLFVMPITHSQPRDEDNAVLLPAETKLRLGLDSEPSWIITNEVNKFIWPGFDVRRCDNGTYSYGCLPESIIKQCLDAVKKHSRQRSLQAVSRD